MLEDGGLKERRNSNLYLHLCDGLLELPKKETSSRTSDWEELHSDNMVNDTSGLLGGWCRTMFAGKSYNRTWRITVFEQARV